MLRAGATGTITWLRHGCTVPGMANVRWPIITSAIVIAYISNMGDHFIKLSVFVASPNDVREERDRIQRVVEEFNLGIAKAQGLILELIRWETHAWPDIGDDAQDVINRQIPIPDIFIGILWKRFGTPTKRADSGTQEEFERA